MDKNSFYYSYTNSTKNRMTGQRPSDCKTEAMQRLLRRRPLPTAVFAATDLTAIGAMHAIREAGLSVPGDISVVGLDNVDVAAFQNPPLTTIRQFLSQLAELGVQMLLDLLAGKTPSPSQVVIEPALVIRQSTAAPPQRRRHLNVANATTHNPTEGAGCSDVGG